MATLFGFGGFLRLSFFVLVHEKDSLQASESKCDQKGANDPGQSIACDFGTHIHKQIHVVTL